MLECDVLPRNGEGVNWNEASDCGQVVEGGLWPGVGGGWQTGWMRRAGRCLAMQRREIGWFRLAHGVADSILHSIGALYTVVGG